MVRAIAFHEGQRHAELGMVEAFVSGMGKAAQRRERMPLIPWARKYLPHYVPLECSPFHVDLTAELERMTEERGQQFLEIAPRDSAKSVWISMVYPLYSICQGTEPYIILAAESMTQAKKRIVDIRTELEVNDKLAVDYPEVFGPGPRWTDDGLTMRTGQRIECVGAGMSLRGRREREERPSLLVIDDPEDNESMYSVTIRDRRWNWLQAAVKFTKSPTTNIALVGTMIHEECAVGRALKMPGWRNRKVWPSIIEYPERMDLWDEWEQVYYACQDDEQAEAQAFFEKNEDEMKRGSVVLWEQRHDLLSLMKERAQDRDSFQRERQNKPLPPEGTKWPAEWFEGDDLWFDEPAHPCHCFVAVDPATGKSKKKGDYSAVVWGWWKDGDTTLYVDAWLTRKAPTQVNEGLLDLHEKHEFHWCAYEAIAFQEVARRDLQQRFDERSCAVPVLPVAQKDNKFQRIERLGPLLQRGKLRFRRGSPGADLLVRQLKNFAFPAVDKLDGPDALEMLIRLIAMYDKKRRNPAGFSVAGTVLR